MTKLTFKQHQHKFLLEYEESRCIRLVDRFINDLENVHGGVELHTKLNAIHYLTSFYKDRINPNYKLHHTNNSHLEVWFEYGSENYLTTMRVSPEQRCSNVMGVTTTDICAYVGFSESKFLIEVYFPSFNNRKYAFEGDINDYDVDHLFELLKTFQKNSLFLDMSMENVRVFKDQIGLMLRPAYDKSN